MNLSFARDSRKYHPKSFPSGTLVYGSLCVMHISCNLIVQGFVQAFGTMCVDLIANPYLCIPAIALIVIQSLLSKSHFGAKLHWNFRSFFHRRVTEFGAVRQDYFGTSV
jgi:hypothetical protein